MLLFKQNLLELTPGCSIQWNWNPDRSGRFLALFFFPCACHRLPAGCFGNMTPLFGFKPRKALISLSLEVRPTSPQHLSVLVEFGPWLQTINLVCMRQTLKIFLVMNLSEKTGSIKEFCCEWRVIIYHWKRLYSSEVGSLKFSCCLAGEKYNRSWLIHYPFLCTKDKLHTG